MTTKALAITDCVKKEIYSDVHYILRYFAAGGFWSAAADAKDWGGWDVDKTAW